MELWGFVSFGVWLAKEFLWEWGIPRKLLGDPQKFFPFLLQEGIDICQRQVLGVGSPSHCRPSLWLGPILVAHRGDVVSNLLRLAFFEEANLLL